MERSRRDFIAADPTALTCKWRACSLSESESPADFVVGGAFVETLTLWVCVSVLLRRFDDYETGLTGAMNAQAD